ncbi:MAG: N-6 DNA methylase [Leptospiraceae bacterium]|nr:N-6 DNA methylase [Leptospiraceae bacterium]
MNPEYTKFQSNGFNLSVKKVYSSDSKPSLLLLTDIVDPKIGEKVLDPACGTGGFLSACVEKLKTLAKTTKERDSIQKNIMGIEFKPLPYMLAVTNMILHDVALPSIEERDSLDKPVTEYKEKDRVDIILANPPFGGVVTEGYEKNFPLNYRTKESADLFLVLFINLLKEGGRAAIVLPDGSLTGDGVKQRIRELWMTKCNLHTIIRLPNSVFQPYASVATNLLFFEKGTPTKDIWYYEHTLPEGQKSYSKTKPIQVNEFDPIKKWWNKRKESEVCWKVNIKEIEARGYDLDIKNPNKKEEEHEYTSKELISMLGESFSKSDKILKVIQKELKVG